MLGKLNRISQIDDILSILTGAVELLLIFLFIRNHNYRGVLLFIIFKARNIRSIMRKWLGIGVKNTCVFFSSYFARVIISFSSSFFIARSRDAIYSKPVENKLLDALY